MLLAPKRKFQENLINRFELKPKKSVGPTAGTYYTESKAFFTFLKLTHRKLTHRVLGSSQKSGSLQKSKNSLYIQYIRPLRYNSTDLFKRIFL